jgi:hypothetical protein
VCSTTFATLRWTKTSPGARPMIWFAAMRLSEQPIQSRSGACCASSRLKKLGSSFTTSAAHFRFAAKHSSSRFTATQLP